MCSALTVAIALSLCADWGQQSNAQGTEYVPMIWGSDEVGKLTSLPASDWVLAFNEPNMSKCDTRVTLRGRTRRRRKHGDSHMCSMTVSLPI